MAFQQSYIKIITFFIVVRTDLNKFVHSITYIYVYNTTFTFQFETRNPIRVFIFGKVLAPSVYSGVEIGANVLPIANV